jgi:hypothetical protein
MINLHIHPEDGIETPSAYYFDFYFYYCANSHFLPFTALPTPPAVSQDRGEGLGTGRGRV